MLLLCAAWWAALSLLRRAQLLDDPWNTVSMGISRLTVAASSVASATVATVKPGLQARAGGAASMA